MKKIIKVILICFFSIMLILLVIRINEQNNLKKIGYNESQIKKMYDLSYDIKVILNNQYCDKIDEILNNNFDESNLASYLQSCNEVITEDQNNSIINELKQEKYYIPSNLDRYIKYKDLTNKTINEVVTEVNCNLDNEFYTNIKETDLTKGNLILVNKYYYVGETFEPVNPKELEINKYTYWQGSVLSEDAYTAFIKMVEDAKKLGYSLIDTSAYRTYEYQSYLYNKYLQENGLEWTLKSSAKPGHSEHHTGLATDIVKNGVSMYELENTSEFKWLQENAHLYGFILRYPKGKEYLTGYKYEPWHYRYVGVEAAKYIYEENIVFEEYYAYFCEYKNEC